MRALVAALVIVTGFGSQVSAKPLDAKQVSGDAKWLVHIDVDAVTAGEVPQTVGTLWLKLPSAPEGLRKLSKAIGMDPTKDLHGITIYGRRHTQASGVVIVRAELDRGRLMALLKRKPDYRTESYGSHELVLWTENKRKKDEHTVTGCFYRPTVIVFGRDTAEVKKALDVLDGKSPALAESDPLFSPDVPAGTMIQARAVGLADVQLPFKSPLVRKSRFLFVGFGERGSEAFVVARLETESAEVAGQVRAVVEGFLAMAKLRWEADKEATKLLDAVEVSTDETRVAVKWRAPTDEVGKLLEKAWIKQLKSKGAD